MARGAMTVGHVECQLRARSRHGGGEGNDEFVLTKTQTNRLRDGGGRGDHSEALGELGNAFL